MDFEAKMIEDSISPDGVRLSTLQLRYPRFVHSEFMTHRVFSRNASSSRAIPVAKMIEQVRNHPAMPVHWGANQAGMQARGEVSEPNRKSAQLVWKLAAEDAADYAGQLMDLGLHKQVANRILEPFQWISVIVTFTERDNFYELRDHEDADPNIARLARLMKAAENASTPIKRDGSLWAENWHLPYITTEERTTYAHAPRMLAKISAARCARVSYLTHEGKEPSVDADFQLYERLVGSRPLHASPVEHQAYPTWGDTWSGNFRGWVQHRKLVEAEILSREY